MHQQLGAGMFLALPGQAEWSDAGVNVALAQPNVEVLPAGDPSHVCAEEKVGEEEDLLSTGIELTISTAFPDVQQ